MKEREAQGKTRPKATSSLYALCLLTILFISIIFSIPLSSAQDDTDTDGDGIPDAWEDEYGYNSTDPSDSDLDDDNDSLDTFEEYENGTNPRSNDTDNDEMPDGWEVRYALDPLDPSDAEKDPDGDNYTNVEEYLNGTDPRDPASPSTGTDDDDDTGAGGEDTDEAVSKQDEAAAASLCILFVFFLGGVIVVIIVIGFYTKIKRDKLLDHETRQHIVDYIRENPGAYYSQMRKDLDLAHGVLTHHINMLEQQEAIFSKQDRSYRRFYLEGMNGKGPIVVGNQKTVLEAVRRYPGSSQSKLAKKLGVSRMVVNYHVSALEDLGLVEKRKNGRETSVYPAEPEDVSETPMGPVPEDEMEPYRGTAGSSVDLEIPRFGR